MNELLDRFESDLAFIEDPEDYYAMFRYVIVSCIKAQIENELLHKDGVISGNKYVENLNRIERAKELAIKTHGEWTIKMLEQSKTPHTRRTLVCSIFSDIFGVQLETGSAETDKPQVKKVNFEINRDSTYESFIHQYFDAYEITGASVEWEEGWRAAIAWCKKIIDALGKK